MEFLYIVRLVPGITTRGCPPPSLLKYITGILMSMGKGNIPAMPADAPKAEEVYKHYKGDNYKVVDLALDAVGQEWVVVYEPLYECPIKLFTRPLREWREVVEWQGQKVERFVKV